MLRFPHTLTPRRHPTRMLVVGLFAMLLHLLAGTGLVRASVSGEAGFIPDICGSHGAANPGAGQAPSGSQGGHDCCKLCAAGVPPILSSTAITVAPAPTFVAHRATAETPARSFAPIAAHRPRGPPATS